MSKVMKQSRLKIQIICIICILNIFTTLPFLESTILCFCEDTDIVFASTTSHCNSCDIHHQETHIDHHHKHDCSDFLPFQYSYLKKSENIHNNIYKIEASTSNTCFYSNNTQYLKNYSSFIINSQIDLKANLILIC